MFRPSKIEILRDSITKVTQILTEKNIKVTQIGTSAYVERDKAGIPQLVNLPYIPESASDELLSAMQGFVDHEVAHVLFSDPKSAMKAKAKGKKIESLYGYFNDAYAEGEMRKAFRGSNRNLGELASFYTDRRLKDRWGELDESGASEKEKLGAMMGAVTRAWSGDVFYDDFMTDKWEDLSTVLDKVPQDFIDSLKNINSSEDAFQATQTFLKYIEMEEEQEGSGGDDDGDDENENENESAGGGASDGDDDEEGGGSGLGGGSDDDSEDDDEGGGSGGASAEPADDDDESGEGDAQSFGGIGDDDPFSEGMEGTGKFQDALNEAVSQEFKESKHEYVAMTTEYDEVLVAPSLAQCQEFGSKSYVGKTPTSEAALKRENDIVNKLHEEAVIDVGAASKQLEKAFMSQNRTFYESGKRSGRINPSSLFKLKTGDDRVFRKKVEIRAKNSAVSLVIDQSGSMCSANRLQMASVAAYALAEVLTRIKIPFEIVGFTTAAFDSNVLSYEKRRDVQEKFRAQTGRTGFSREGRIIWNVYKSFEERFEYTQKTRMAAAYDHSVTMSSNADAESIAYCAKRLGERNEPRKCMIVLSDGQPACSGNSDDQNTHLVNVVKKIEKAGIDVVGLGISSDAVKQYYSRNIVFHDSAEIASRVIGELSRMLVASS